MEIEPSILPQHIPVKLHSHSPPELLQSMLLMACRAPKSCGPSSSLILLTSQQQLIRWSLLHPGLISSLDFWFSSYFTGYSFSVSFTASSSLLSPLNVGSPPGSVLFSLLFFLCAIPSWSHLGLQLYVLSTGWSQIFICSSYFSPQIQLIYPPAHSAPPLECFIASQTSPMQNQTLGSHNSHFSSPIFPILVFHLHFSCCPG